MVVIPFVPINVMLAGKGSPTNPNPVGQRDVPMAFDDYHAGYQRTEWHASKKVNWALRDRVV
jgi:hypothetical protein